MCVSPCRLIRQWPGGPGLNPLSLQHPSIFYVSYYISAWPTLAQLTLAAMSADNHPHPGICFSPWLPVNGPHCTELNLLTSCVIEFQTPTQKLKSCLGNFYLLLWQDLDYQFFLYFFFKMGFSNNVSKHLPELRATVNCTLNINDRTSMHVRGFLFLNLHWPIFTQFFFSLPSAVCK